MLHYSFPLSFLGVVACFLLIFFLVVTGCLPAALSSSRSCLLGDGGGRPFALACCSRRFKRSYRGFCRCILCCCVLRDRRRVLLGLMRARRGSPDGTIFIGFPVSDYFRFEAERRGVPIFRFQLWYFISGVSFSVVGAIRRCNMPRRGGISFMLSDQRKDGRSRSGLIWSGQG